MMRRFLAVVFVLFFATGPSFAAWTHVQSATPLVDTSGTNSATWAVSFTAGVSANSGVSGEFMFDNTGGATLVTIVSDKGDVAVIADSNSDPGNEGAVSYYFPGLTAGAKTLTATLSLPTGFVGFSAEEDSPGAGFVPAIDGHNTRLQTGVTTGTNNITTNAFTPATNGDLIKAFSMTSNGQVVNWSAGTSPNAFTARTNVGGSFGTILVFSEDFVQTTAANITPTITGAVPGGSVNAVSFGLAFKIAGAPPPTGGTRRSLTGVGN